MNRRWCGLMSMAFALLLMYLATNVVSQRFGFPYSTRSPSLQVDERGETIVSAGSKLYRLNSNLEHEETRDLTSEAVNISLSTDGRWLVVCLTDLSCEVYNTTNLSAQPVFRRENVIRSTENVALFAVDDSFYVGSIDAGQNLMVLGQYEFAGRRGAQSATYAISRDGFVRNFYNGFVKGNYSYYFAVDNNPTRIRGIRVIRVCHKRNFSALYELLLGCGGVTPSFDTRISGVSVVENFAGMFGTVVVLSRSRLGSTQNFVCLYSLQPIDNMMQSKLDSCSLAGMNSREQIRVAWRQNNINIFCDTLLVISKMTYLSACFYFILCTVQPSSNVCDFRITNSEQPLALDDLENLYINRIHEINIGRNFITASTAALLDSLLLVFAAILDENGNSFIIGVSIVYHCIMYGHYMNQMYMKGITD